MSEQFAVANTVCKVDPGLGLVFGWAIVCLEKGQPHFDLQDDHIPEDAMMKAATEFMTEVRAIKDMHQGDVIKDGLVVFAWPMTTDVAKAFGIKTAKTGLMIAMKPPKDILAKYESGEYTGFSIGGRSMVNEAVDVEDDN